MIRSLGLAAFLFLLAAGCGDTAPADGPAVANRSVEVTKAASPKARAPEADIVRVRIETEVGAMVVALDHRRAPVTAANFLAYVDQQRFDGTNFYRAARTPQAQGRGFIQGGIRRNARRALGPIAHEPTSRTGIRHGEGTISMARPEGAAGAMGDFFITASAMPSMDARGGEPGYAAFGRVVEGMDVVRRILAAPTVANAGSGAMRGQFLEAPVRIVRVRRAE